MEKLTEKQMDNLKRNFVTGSKGVLTVEAHDSWKPIILHLLDNYGPPNKGKCNGSLKSEVCKRCGHCECICSIENLTENRFR